ncbi:MAG: hypothetical protein ACKKL4_00945 [Patescibacteria group bacterium]
MSLHISSKLREELTNTPLCAHRKDKGMIKMIILIIIAIIIVSVLGFDIRSAIEHPQTQENFSYLAQFAINFWNNYLANIWAVIWNVIGPILTWFWDQLAHFSWQGFSADTSHFLDQAPRISNN